MDTGGTVEARNLQYTKLPELVFHAVLGDGARELRFERLLVRWDSWEAAGGYVRVRVLS